MLPQTFQLPGWNSPAAKAAAFVLASIAMTTGATAQQSLTVDGANSPFTYSSANGYNTQYSGVSVGVTGTGVMNQTGGYFTTGSLFLGGNAGSSGTYNLSSNETQGAFRVSYLTVGYQGMGTFNQTGSSAIRVDSNFSLASEATPTPVTSSYTMSNGSLFVGFDAYFGRNPNGVRGNPAVFNMNGGAATFLTAARLDNATINLNGGVLNFNPITTAATVFNFNGGTFTGFYSADSGLATLNVRSGGAVLGTGNMTFSQPFVHSSIVGDPVLDGGVTVTSSGSVNFKGANTYTGPTRVNGSLNVQNTTGSATSTGAVTVGSGGSISGPGSIGGSVTVTNGGSLLNFGRVDGSVTVADGGRLSGTGRIGGLVTINSNGVISPGSGSGGVLSVVANATLEPGADFMLDLNGTATVSNHSLLSVAGTVSLSGADLVIRDSFSSSTLKVGETVTIITDAAMVGQFSSGASVTSNTGATYQINYNVGSVSLTVLSVPEPSTWALLGAGALALGMRRTRRVTA